MAGKLIKALGGLAVIVGLAGTSAEGQDTLRHSQHRSYQEFYENGREELPEGVGCAIEPVFKAGAWSVHPLKRTVQETHYLSKTVLEKIECNGRTFYERKIIVEPQLREREEIFGYDLHYNKEDALLHKGYEEAKRFKERACEDLREFHRGVKRHGRVLKEDLCDIGDDVGCAGRNIIERGIDISISVNSKLKEHIARSKERCKTSRPEYHHPRTCRPITCMPKEPEFYIPAPQTCKPATSRPVTCAPKMPMTCTPAEPVYIPEPATCRPKPLTCRPKHITTQFNIQRPSTCTPQSNQIRYAYEHKDGSKSYFNGNLSRGDIFIESVQEYGPNGNTQINIYKRNPEGPLFYQAPSHLHDQPGAEIPPFPKPTEPVYPKTFK